MNQEYPVTTLCQVLDINRSSFYYQPATEFDDDLKHAITQLAAEHPTYGYRRMTALLHRQGQIVNHKRVQRIMHELNLVGKCPQRRCRTTNSNHNLKRYPNRVEALRVERPNQVWVGDITYIRLGSEFVYLAVLMDVFTRSIRGWQLGRSLATDLPLIALKRALKVGKPEIHHSDQGVQYAAKAYTELLEVSQIEISMAAVGEAWQNGYAERLMRTIKEEEVDLSEYRNFEEAYEQIGEFLEEVYTKKRIHSSLGYLTPMEFENQWNQQQNKSQKKQKPQQVVQCKNRKKT